MALKSFIRALMLVVCLVSMAYPSIPAQGEGPVKIGVLAFRPKAQTLEQWKPLADILKQAIPERDFVVEALTYPELDQAVAARQLDFILTNSGHYVVLEKRNGLSSPLATVIALNKSGPPSIVYGGVIFCRAGQANINTLHDIKGKTIAIVTTEAFAGYQMQAYELSHAGLHMPQDVKLITTGMPHDKVVLEVLAGHAEVGFVRTNVLEGMERDGKLDIKKLKIINSQALPGFPQKLSTPLYPEWPFVAMPGIDENLARHVAATLFMLGDDPDATRAMGILGFAVPADYSPVEDVLRELRLPPFDVVPHFTILDIWSRYRWQTIGGGVAFGVILCLGVSLLFANRKLVAKRLLLEQQQNKLQENEEKFRTVADHTLGWEYWQGAEHEMLYISPSCEAVTGYSPAEFIADPNLLSRVVHPDDRQKENAHLHDISNQEDGDLIFRVIRRDGGIRWVEHICHPVWNNDGVFKGRRVSNRDITERKQVEEELKVSEERFRNLVETTTDWVWEVDMNGVYTYASPAVRSLLGYEPEYVLGKTPFDLMPPEEVKRVAEIFTSLIAEHKPIEYLENINLHKDGRQVILETCGAPFFDLDGILTGYRGVDRNITERKHAEEERMKLSTIVERSLNEIYLFDSETLRFIHANLGALQNLHYTLDELKKLTALDIKPEFTEATFRAMVQPLLSDQRDRIVFETVHRRSDNTRYPVEVHLQLMVSGQQRIFLAVIFDISERKKMEAEKEMLIVELQNALAQVKLLNGLLPICASCKKIRDDKGYWTQIESYISAHSEARFSHGICQECVKKLYPEICDENGNILSYESKT